MTLFRPMLRAFALGAAITILVPSTAAADQVGRRNLDDAFVDTFFLSGVDPIRAQMPINLGDTRTNLLAGLRVDSLAAVAAGGPYASIDDMFMAFYNNQKAFNQDPSRNHIRMHGRITETPVPDGTALIRAKIAYRDLPLSVYTNDSWDDALFVQLDPARIVKVLVDGSLNGHMELEMLIPRPGAPLHFWDAAIDGRIRSLSFTGHGRGWLVDAAGNRTGRARVSVEAGGFGTSDIVRLKPIGSDSD